MSSGTSRRRASAKASSPHGYQSTGLSACARRYGLRVSASRLVIASTLRRAWRLRSADEEFDRTRGRVPHQRQRTLGCQSEAGFEHRGGDLVAVEVGVAGVDAEGQGERLEEREQRTQLVLDDEG